MFVENGVTLNQEPELLSYLVGSPQCQEIGLWGCQSGRIGILIKTLYDTKPGPRKTYEQTLPCSFRKRLSDCWYRTDYINSSIWFRRGRVRLTDFFNILHLQQAPIALTSRCFSFWPSFKGPQRPFRTPTSSLLLWFVWVWKIISL